MLPVLVNPVVNSRRRPISAERILSRPAGTIGSRLGRAVRGCRAHGAGAALHAPVEPSRRGWRSCRGAPSGSCTRPPAPASRKHTWRSSPSTSGSA
eukprot:4469011-Pleurochrysis_carterae.AAC.1